jgi:hypothetical protein
MPNSTTVVKPDVRNALIAHMLKQGMDTSPVQHWTQGMARALQGAVGGLERGRAEFDDKQNEAAQNSALAAMLGGAATPPAAAPPAQPMSSAPPMQPPRPPASTPQNVPGPVPQNDPTMSVTPRQVQMANGPQQPPAPPPITFGDGMTGQPDQLPPPGPALPQPSAMPMTSSVAPPDVQARVRQALENRSNPAGQRIARGLGGQILAERMKQSLKPPEYGVIDKDEFGNDRRGWINPNTRELTPASPPSIPNFVDTKKLRDEVRDLPSYKNLTQAAPVYKSMYEAAGRDNRAADVNLIYGMAKIMDPGSVVRESEMTVAQAVATLPQQLQSTIMSQLNSTGRLSPEVRASIMQEAHSRISAYQGTFDTDMGMYRSIAQQGRFNPSHVIPSFGPFEQFKATPPAGGAGSPPPAGGQGAAPPQGAAPRPRAQNAQGQVIEWNGQQWAPVK